MEFNVLKKLVTSIIFVNLFLFYLFNWSVVYASFNSDPVLIPQAIKVSTAGNEIDLDWEMAINSPSVRGFEVYRGTIQDQETFLGKTATSNFKTTVASLDTTYYFKIRTVDINNNVSQFSQTISIVPTRSLSSHVSITTAGSDYTINTPRYSGILTKQDKKLRIYDSNNTLMFTADLTTALVKGSLQTPIISGNLNVTVVGSALKITFSDTTFVSAHTLIINFLDDYITYFTEDRWDSISQGENDDLLFSGKLEGGKIGTLNPKIDASGVDGLYMEENLPYANTNPFGTLISNNPGDHDSFIFTPTVNAWYLKNNQTLFFHGLMEYSRGLGLEFRVNGTTLQQHSSGKVYRTSGVYTGFNIQTPKSAMFVINEGDPSLAYKKYREILEGENKIQKTTKPYYNWWGGISFDTWAPQEENYNNSTSQNILDWLSTLENAKIKFQIINIEPKWFKYFGDFEADPSKFPDMRATVEALHAKGYKVIFWLSPFDVELSSNVAKNNPSYLLRSGNGSPLLNGHTATYSFDLSNPNTQAYYKSGLKKLLSTEEGSYNGDGILLDYEFDFMDPGYNPAYVSTSHGVGEDFYHWSKKFIYDSVKAIKPDAMVQGMGVNPLYLDTMDIERLNDLQQNNVEGFLKRGVISQILMPNILAKYDTWHDGDKSWAFRYIARAMIHGLPEIDYIDAVPYQTNYMSALTQAYYLIRDKRKVTDVTDFHTSYDAYGNILLETFSDGEGVAVYGDNETRLITNNTTLSQTSKVYLINTQSTINSGIINTPIPLNPRSVKLGLGKSIGAKALVVAPADSSQTVKITPLVWSSNRVQLSASGTTNTTFTISYILKPQTLYEIRKDGITSTTCTTDATGKCNFAISLGPASVIDLILPPAYLLKNYSFEDNNNGAPAQWADFPPYVYWDSSTKHTGNASLKITGASLDDYNYQHLTLKPNTNYSYNLWIKTENIKGMGISARYAQLTPVTRVFQSNSWINGTTDWVQIVGSFTTPSNYQNGRFDVIWNISSGTAWVDDVQLCEGTACLAPILMTANPTRANSGENIAVSWSNISYPVSNDFIGLYKTGTPNEQELDWMYVSCSKINRIVRVSGSCQFPLPNNLPIGNYEFRLFSGGVHNRISTSNQITTPR